MAEKMAEQMAEQMGRTDGPNRWAEQMGRKASPLDGGVSYIAAFAYELRSYCTILRHFRLDTLFCRPLHFAFLRRLIPAGATTLGNFKTPPTE